MHPRRALLAACIRFGAMLLIGSSIAQAQTYPVRPMRLITPFAPGGGTTILAHLIATPVSEALGQPVVVDNRPGAGGAVGAEIVARAEPDGYTIILVSASYCATSAYRRLPYDPVSGIQPIILIGTTGLLMTVHPSVPAVNIKELIDYAHAHPSKLVYASVGIGAVNHLSHELFMLMTKTSFLHVPYKGGGPALAAVVSGEAQITSVSAVPTLPHLRAGRLRALAITTPKRSALLPDVPAVSETVPGYEVTHWYGMWGPKGMPPAAVGRWNQEVKKVLSSEAMQRQMRTEGLDTAGGPPEQLRELIAADVAKWRRVIIEGKIKRAD